MPLLNGGFELNFGRHEDAVLKFSPWVPGIAAGWAGVGIDALIGAVKRL